MRHSHRSDQSVPNGCKRLTAFALMRDCDHRGRITDHWTAAGNKPAAVQLLSPEFLMRNQSHNAEDLNRAFIRSIVRIASHLGQGQKMPLL